MPKDRGAKGVLLLTVIKALDEEKKKQLEQELGKLDFSPFKDYPHETYIQLVEKAASLLASDKAEGMRLLGKKVYENVKDVPIVKVFLLAYRPKTFEDMLMKGLPTAYERLTSYSRAAVEKTGEKEYLIRIRNTDFFADPYIAHYHRGIIEGLAETYGAEIECRVLKVEENTATIKVVVKN